MTDIKQKNPFAMSKENMDKFIENFGKNNHEIHKRIEEMRFNRYVRQ